MAKLKMSASRYLEPLYQSVEGRYNGDGNYADREKSEISSLQMYHKFQSYGLRPLIGLIPAR